MQLAMTAPLQPGCCFLCHSASGPFVDLQHDDEDPREAGRAGVQFGGVFHHYLCVTCAMSAAQIVEKHSPSTIISRAVLEDERAIHAAAAVETAQLRVENEELRSTIRVIGSFAEAHPPAEPAPEPVPATRGRKARA